MLCASWLQGTCERSLSRVLGLDRGLEGAQRYLAAGGCSALDAQILHNAAAWYAFSWRWALV